MILAKACLTSAADGCLGQKLSIFQELKIRNALTIPAKLQTVRKVLQSGTSSSRDEQLKTANCEKHVMIVATSLHISN